MSKSHVSMGQHVCPVCGKVHDSGEILIDKRLKDSLEKYTVTGYGECEECKAKIDDDRVAMVVASGGVAGDRLQMEDANRTGEIIFLRRYLFNQLFNVEISEDQRMVFIDPDAAEMIKQKLGDGNEV